jgi:hypothetical protein
MRKLILEYYVSLDGKSADADNGMSPAGEAPSGSSCQAWHNFLAFQIGSRSGEVRTLVGRANQSAATAQ